jgi:putative ubiquitin-RnfH superfamily antitoxin RatB of RatAB toxin-antitoxin module
MAPAESGLLRVDVAIAPAPRTAHVVALRLPPGSTVADAVRASALLAEGALQGEDGLVTSVWGRIVEPTTVLRDLDRVELLRPLLVDPKESRRLRGRRQAERTGSRRR